MKNLLFTFALSLCFGFASFAQTAQESNYEKQMALDKQATTLTREMANEIGLNELEYIKLKALNKEKLKRTDEIEAMYSNDPSMKQAKLRELDANFEEKLAPILSPRQTEQYAIYKDKSNSNIAVLSEEEDAAPVIEEEAPVIEE